MKRVPNHSTQLPSKYAVTLWSMYIYFFSLSWGPWWRAASLCLPFRPHGNCPMSHGNKMSKAEPSCKSGTDAVIMNWNSKMRKLLVKSKLSSTWLHTRTFSLSHSLFTHILNALAPISGMVRRLCHMPNHENEHVVWRYCAVLQLPAKLNQGFSSLV